MEINTFSKCPFWTLDSQLTFFRTITMPSLIKGDKSDIKVHAVVQDVSSPLPRHADDAKLAELGYKSEFKREFSVSLCSSMKIK